MSMRTPGNVVTGGELIDVRDTAVVVLAQGELVLVRWELVHDARFVGMPSLPRRGLALDAEQRAALRRVSRFPQGMSAELEARFLAALRRPAMRVIDR